MVIVLAGFLAADLSAQVTIKPAPPGNLITVNNGPGDQSDPHVSGNLVSYSNSDGTNFTIRYFDLTTQIDKAIPNSGTFDFLADVSGSTIAYTLVNSSESAIYKFDTAAVGPPVAVDPMANSMRQAAGIGGNTIVWQDNGFSPSSNIADIVVYDPATGTATRLANDSAFNTLPAVSPDGAVIAWTKCQDSTASTCDVWSATGSGATWVKHQLTNGNGNCSHPDTNGQVVVYSCNRGTGDHLYWQASTGGVEQSLGGALNESWPSIAGQFVEFAGLQAGANQHDIYVLNISNLILYQITNTPDDEQLGDISITPDGHVNVVWQVLTLTGQSGEDIYAYTFKVPVADLAIKKFGFPSTVYVGQQLAYGLSVYNFGPDTATDVVVTDSLPTNTVYVNTYSTQGSCTGPTAGGAGTVKCALDNVGKGSYAFIGLLVKVTGGAGTIITNSASVGASSFDANTNNNSATVNTTVAQNR
jgi:uncharacterized repeat protein (TIGR01451 family)